MINKKRLLCISCALVLLIIGLFGCGKNLSDTETTLSDATSETNITAISSEETLATETETSIENIIPATTSTILNTTASNNSTLPADTLKVHFIDVGQGDAIFVELPNKQTMLIDAGDSNFGSSIVSYIKNLGYGSITYLVATHPHADHIGGMPNVINNLSIQSIYMPKVTHTTKTFENLLMAIQNKGLTIKSAKAGVSILSGPGLSINIIAPVGSSYDDLNNYSAVVKLVYGNNSFLFMGDAEALSESQITASVQANVLKVGHHGSTSSTTSTFLTKVSPQYAVIMCGSGNTYGHPHTETLSKLNNAKVVIYRTDLNSTIVFTSDGTNISAKTTKAGGTIGTSATATTTVKQNNSTTTDDVNFQYIGNLNSHKFHLPSCRTLPAESNRIYFNARNDAINAGYVPCKNCNP